MTKGLNTRVSFTNGCGTAKLESSVSLTPPVCRLTPVWLS